MQYQDAIVPEIQVLPPGLRHLCSPATEEGPVLVQWAILHKLLRAMKEQIKL